MANVLAPFGLRHNDNLKNELIGRTREVWRRRLGRDLSREDARQIVENVTGFFSVLAEWSRAEMPSSANDTGKPDETDASAPSLAANSKVTDFAPDLPGARER
jgi:hypothetical protein